MSIIEFLTPARFLDLFDHSIVSAWRWKKVVRYYRDMPAS